MNQFLLLTGGNLRLRRKTVSRQRKAKKYLVPAKSRGSIFKSLFIRCMRRTIERW